jgi:hypothetical protein
MRQVATTPQRAGYSGKPLAEKLGLKPGLTVYVDQPPAHLDTLLPGVGYATRLPKRADVILAFHTEATTLRRRLPALVEHTTPNGMVWICWPKKTSGVASDLGEGLVREIGLAAGVVDVKVAAVDGTWSGLKFVRRLSDR